MSKKKALIVTQEMQPYTALNEISQIARKLPQFLQENGLEIRVLMPRFGSINERRHRLHEVVRLSGMNIIVDDDDYPLIIKVASLPEARMQVYFLDNDDFFKRKSLFENNKGEVHADNADRMVFFCKGVLETVKKFGWAPDVIHCHGWMTSLIPLYLKSAYKSEPIFQNAKVIYSLYEDAYSKNFDESFVGKASINNLSESDLDAYHEDGAVTLHQGAFTYSDAITLNSALKKDQVSAYLESTDKSIMTYDDEESFFESVLDFYNALLAEEVS
jgi:starch synthase